VARRILAGSLIMFGLIIGQIGAVVWWVDREVADPDQLASIAATVVRDDDFRSAITPEITDQLVASGLSQAVVDREVVESAVNAALADPAVVEAVSNAIAGLASSVIGNGDATILLELDAIHIAVVDVLRDVDASLANDVDAFDPPEAIALDVGRFPDLSTPVAAMTVVWMLAIGIGGLLALLGMLVHPRPAKGFRRIGALLAIGAGIQLGLAWVLAEVLATNIPGDGLATAGGIGLRIVLDGWRVQAIVQLCAGAVVTVIGHIWLWIPNLAGRHQPAAA
jgi:hypothetical protein